MGRLLHNIGEFVRLSGVQPGPPKHGPTLQMQRLGSQVVRIPAGLGSGKDNVKVIQDKDHVTQVPLVQQANTQSKYSAKWEDGNVASSPMNATADCAVASTRRTYPPLSRNSAIYHEHPFAHRRNRLLGARQISLFHFDFFVSQPARSAMSTNVTVILPAGSTTHGDPNLMCVPPSVSL